MFYSQQLLERKGTFGPIWMAATMHEKINRRKLDKLDILQIWLNFSPSTNCWLLVEFRGSFDVDENFRIYLCIFSEDILNPSVPMTLRLSGILMGGVVIVYEKKVKLLYDDVSRFLVEFNAAWKVKPKVDRTVLSKRKAQAKFEAVTLPEAIEMEVEQSMNFFSSASQAGVKFQSMRLDDLEEHFIKINLGGDDQSQHHHQADPAKFTLFDDVGSSSAETDLYNRFERFDIEGEEEIEMNFTPQEQPILSPSPRSQDEPRLEEQEERQYEDQINETQEECEIQHAQEIEPARGLQNSRKAHRILHQVIMDDEQTKIPRNTYHLWLLDASSVVSKRGRKTKSRHPIFTTEISNLMELPPLALMTGLGNFPSELHYPAPLLELWSKCVNTIATAHSSTSEGMPPEAPQNPALHSPFKGLFHRNKTNTEFLPGDSQSRNGSQHDVSPIEKSRAEPVNMDFHSIFNDADMGSSDRFDTSRSPAGQNSGSNRSSGSGNALLPFQPEISITSMRYKRRQHSSARSDLGNLDPVEEEVPTVQCVRDFKMQRLSENKPPQDSDLLEETEPTETPHPVITQPTEDKITQSIRMHLKSQFDTPGNSQSESSNKLASGMNRKQAAALFYQTCVLATKDFVKVHQADPYGDIVISRGSKM